MSTKKEQAAGGRGKQREKPAQRRADRAKPSAGGRGKQREK